MVTYSAWGTAVSCWLMEVGSIRRVGRSRRNNWPRPDFGFWPSTSVATPIREALARATSSPLRLHLDVLAAVHYLRDRGAKSVFAIGGSLGGDAAAAAAIAEPGQIDRLVLLGATPGGPPEKLTVRKLYIMTRDDTNGDGPRLPGLRAHFDKAPEPKELIILDGSAHAQFILGTEQGEGVMLEILRFLSAP